MRITFGDGKIAVSTAMQAEYPLLVLEKGGTGKLGQKVPNRLAGMKISADELDDALLVMEFKNVKAIEILIEQLRALKKYLLSETGRAGIP